MRYPLSMMRWISRPLFSMSSALRPRPARMVVPLILLAILSVQCNMQKTQTNTPPAPSADQAQPALDSELVIPVQAELPKRGDIAAYFETTSRVEAERRVQVMAEAIGQCKQVSVEEGDHVKEGDLLAQLDETELLVTIGQTEVQVRQQKRALEIAEQSLAEGIGAKAERDNAQFAYDQGTAALQMQKVRLQKLSIHAPISGIVTKRNVQVGQLIASGSPLFVIVDPASFILNINIPENELPRLSIGQQARTTVDALGDKEYDAKVRRINPGVDSASGTVKVTLDFDNDVREKMREAAFARIRLVMETRPNALLIPKDAIKEDNARKYLFIVAKAETAPADQQKASPPAGNTPPKADPPAGTAATTPGLAPPAEVEKTGLTAKRVEIETGLEDSSNVEILSGIDDKTLVITVGQQTLKPDALVRVTNADAEMEQTINMSAQDALQAAKQKAEKEAKDPAAKQRIVVHQHH